MSIKFVIADVKSGKAYKKEVDAAKITPVMGLKISDEFDGGVIDLPGYKLKVTGGSGKGGFPMKKGIMGTKTQPVLLAKGLGMKETLKGLRRRKTVTGATISPETTQVNVSVVKYGKQTMEELFGAGEAKEAA